MRETIGFFGSFGSFASYGSSRSRLSASGSTTRLLLLLATIPVFDPGAIARAADPVVPGFVTETYATVAGPVGLAFDSDGVLFAGRDFPGSMGADAVKIHRIGIGGSPVTEYGDSALADPDGVLVDIDGSASGTAGAVLVCGFAGSDTGHLTAILPDQSLVTLSAVPGVLSNPNYMDHGRDGVLITDSDRLKTFQFAAPASLDPLIENPAAPGFLAVDDEGRIFIAHGGGVIRVWDADGTLVDGSYATVGSNYGPLDVGDGGAFGSDLYAMNTVSGELVRVDSEKNVTIVGTGFPTSLGEIEFGPDGALYVAAFDEGRILRVYHCDRECGDPSSPAASVTASDAQFILRTAVGLVDCERCICDVDNSGVILTSDALRNLRVAVGQQIELDCPRPAPVMAAVSDR